ncbi:replicative DNA helicase [Kitasatospora herbaricolor]|uniref:Replicative DNA helicase n=1 Tax=Kitasatospora herbaricolor TaxID=68217 RepID=A0ABZ1WLT1_9ACTN|nr:replicative DNA helicase [Kitasatospora herbaricolor]
MSVPSQSTAEPHDWSDTTAEPDPQDDPAQEPAPAPRRHARKKAGSPDAPEPQASFERVPPGGKPEHLDAEQAVLGSLLMSNDVLADVTDILKPDDYYRPAHGLIHHAVLAVVAKGDPADPITVADELRKRAELDRVGGPGYLHTLVNSVPTAANAEYYAEIVREQAVLRRLVGAGTRIAGMGYAAEGEVDEIVAAAAAEIAQVMESRGREDDFELPDQTIGATLDEIEAAGNRQGVYGVPTGFADLDALTHGWQPGQVIIVAARPGIGKSTLALDFARACTMPRTSAGRPVDGTGRPAAFISLEMSTTELNMRALSAEARVSLAHLRAGALTDNEWERLAPAVERYRAAQLHINQSAKGLPEIQAKLRRLKTRVPDLALVVIDYMQLIEGGSKKRSQDNRQQEVSDISRCLKLLAKELQLPIVVLAQLNRGPEQRNDKKPAVSDLRESGSIEQDADIVILLHRPDAYEPESPRAGETDLIVGKHRNGPQATISVGAQLHYSQFVDMARDTETSDRRPTTALHGTGAIGLGTISAERGTELGWDDDGQDDTDTRGWSRTSNLGSELGL